MGLEETVTFLSKLYRGTQEFASREKEFMVGTVLLAGASIADTISSVMLISNGHKELNPVLEYWVEQVGPVQGILLVKSLLLLPSVALLYLTYYNSTITKKNANTCLKLITGLTTGVATYGTIVYYAHYIK